MAKKRKKTAKRKRAKARRVVRRITRITTVEIVHPDTHDARMDLTLQDMPRYGFTPFPPRMEFSTLSSTDTRAALDKRMADQDRLGYPEFKLGECPPFPQLKENV